MIKGIGVDIVDNHRFARLLEKYNRKIAKKILSNMELIKFDQAMNKPAFLSKKFAAKEALSKAIGTGLYRNGFYPSKVSIDHDNSGKPFFVYDKVLQAIKGINIEKIHLSISDTSTQAIAFVAVE